MAHVYACTTAASGASWINKKGLALRSREGESNCGHSESVPWHVVTPGWLAATLKGRGSPTVPVIGMLKYCSDTVRGQEQGGCGAHRKRACSSPALWDKARRWWRRGWWWWGGGDGEGSSASPTRHVSQPEEQWRAIPSISGTGEVSSDPIQDLTVNIKPRVLFCFTMRKYVHRIQSCGRELFSAVVRQREQKKKKRKKQPVTVWHRCWRSWRSSPFFVKLFVRRALQTARQEEIHMQYFDYANLERGGEEKKVGPAAAL